MGTSSDVIVVGGGISGTSIAFHLAQRGARVTLVEKDFVASGPTGRSSAIIRQHYSHEVTVRMALNSLHVWQHFRELVGGECGYTQTGFLLGARAVDLDSLKANIALQQRVGINTRFVDAAEMRAIEPELSTEGIVGAAYEPESGYADPAAAANAYAAAARRLGATLVQDTPVTAIDSAGGRVTGVHTARGDLSAGAVVVAAGPWTPRLFQTVGIEIPITAARIQVAFYRWPAGFEAHTVYSDFIIQIYARPESGRQFMVGSIEPEEAGDVVPDPDRFNQQLDYDVAGKFAERLAQRYPTMQHGTFSNGYAALYDVTPDWHMLIDEAPGVRGLFCCAGGSGSNFKSGPAVGEMVARLVLDGRAANDDVNFFRLDRFALGQLRRGQYESHIVG